MEFQITFLISMNFNKTTGNIKKKVVDIFFKYKLDFAYLYLYWQTVQILNAGKSIQS